MDNNAFYVYGVAKSGINSGWQETGIAGKNVYIISKGNFSALVHECEEKAYTSEDPEEIKKMIIAHNRILDKVMEDFNGVIPLCFNTIIKGDKIKSGKNSPEFNLKRWLDDDKEKLEKIWNKIKGKKEYGLRIYYEKDRLIKEISGNKEIEKIKKGLKGKSQGLSYLLQEKAKAKTKELFQNKVNQLKQDFLEKIKKLVEETGSNPSRISLNEEKDLLFSLSILVKEGQIGKIKIILEKEKAKGFSFHLAGPFAPYSFVGNGQKE